MDCMYDTTITRRFGEASFFFFSGIGKVYGHNFVIMSENVHAVLCSFVYVYDFVPT